MSGRLYISTFGCQMNEYDSARMADVLRESEGLELTGDPEEADVVLLNTCSVREKAQEKVFSHLGQWRLLKRRKPGLVIGVGGCVASQEGEGILERAPFVDLVFGPQTIHRLPAMIAKLRASRNPQVDVSFPEIEKFDRLPEPRAEGATAFVSIMEGCSRYCSFCVVPYTRGEEMSRPFAQVDAEVRSLVAQGVREVTLLGQNVNAYRGPRDDGTLVDLAGLIRHVAAFEGLERIRFTTSHPLEFSKSLVDAYADVPKLANYLHLPVQSGSDRILAAMKRGYTRLEYRQKIRRLRCVRARHQPFVRLHRRLPRRNRSRLPADARTDRGYRLRPVVLVHLQQAARHARGLAAGRGAARGEAEAARGPAGAGRRPGTENQRRDGRQHAARAGRAPVAP
jgi:tRNA-2-methylthio-N6-dimethylallyladenosine synthase